MKPRHIFAIILALVFAAGLAWFISGYIRDGVLLPGLQFLWVLRGYVRSISQVWLWGFILLIAFGISAFGLGSVRIHLPPEWTMRMGVQGEAHQLAFWIQRLGQGRYQRWHVAHHLASIAREILELRGANVDRTRELSGPGWDPPPDIQKYLQAALNSNPTTFAYQAQHLGLEADPDVEAVIEYLEKYMETTNEH